MSNPTTDTTPADDPDTVTDPPVLTDPDATDVPEADEQDNGNKEAAKWRTKLRAAEAERDTLREQLAAQHRAVIDWRSANADRGGVDPQLLDAAGINIADLLDDTGHLDMNLVDQFIDATAVKFRVHRSPAPNPQQGSPSAARAAGGLADVFREDLKRNQ